MTPALIYLLCSLVGVGVGVGGTLALTHRASESSIVEAVQAPALTAAETSLAVAQWPAAQTLCAAAVLPDPPRCAVELCALAVATQGGQQPQAMGALDASGLSQAVQVCAGRER